MVSGGMLELAVVCGSNWQFVVDGGVLWWLEVVCSS